jgi:molecular chaperone HtpG
VSVDAARRTLVLRDNGCGLTEQEIVDYLSTIGRGYTRELRERLSMASAAEATELIGQFGLGFLSAFLLASEVTLTTRSFQGGGALRWHSAGDEHYDIQPGAREEIGTTVELHIKPAAAFILQERNLEEAVRTYADFLPIPIYVQDDREPANLMAQPWESPNPDEAMREYVTRAFHGSEPLWLLPLHDAKVALGHGDNVTVPLQGFLFVPPGSTASVREYGDLRVFIRRMFICERERDLLPPWARFVRGVLDSPMLQPTASREGLHQDDNFESVRQALEQQLSAGLRDLSKRDPPTWKQLVRGHSDVMVSWAVKDNEFFDRVKDIVCVRTSRGLLNLPEYLDASNGSLYYVTHEMGSLQEQMLAEGRDVPAIDASWFGVTPFLEKYAARHPEVSLVQMDAETQELLRPVPETKFAALLDFFREQGLRARVASFKPAELPALMIYPQGAETAREAGQALAAGELPPGVAGLVGQFIDERFGNGDDLKGTLYLNAACPLIVKLAEQPVSEAQRMAALTVIHQVARLFCSRMLSAVDAAGSFKILIGALGGLVR